ncbi:hypothetical protein GCM10018980_06150 [Streptomyces capoamus]|uniref:Uncharacterized protein n=1 Tax=Streptomyces capoamus TaxID=68183 RepID=A0A919C1K1_9ACTN|nr:hypothetical protein GCM10018980_06150 [Streptomyces capoamus]
MTPALSAGLRVAVVPLAIRLLVTVPKEPCSTGFVLSPMADGWSEPMLSESMEKPNGSVESTLLFVIRSLRISTAS